MKRYNRIAFIKCGWAEYYQGDRVRGRHGYIQDREAHEKYNFVQNTELDTEQYQIYVPPIAGGKKAPMASLAERDKSEGWLLVFVAAEEGNKRLKIVGWYDNASFLGEYRLRTVFPVEGEQETPTDKGLAFSYCITAPKAVWVPPDERTDDAIIPGRHLGSTSVAYINGNGRSVKRDVWRRALRDKAIAFIEAFEEKHTGGRNE
ncbi:hypothetical protein EIC82_03845 [Enterobacter sp. A11]|uniref:hypothetical protein n=1 Tax=unclassified Enterobacter TaxID=2608935 RepID=UPI00106F4432|nr:MULTISPECIES: hypothetical protein [unclassified Enterobacter]MBM1020220.1 hypothetical protein [Enterobacter sp. E1]MEA3561521.1 hypothetical protein [Enterobacter sp. GM-22]MEA3595183.1 hypothetical protein [Enterobacter sp. GM-31]TFF60320.1 hypothetical protein EIC82_03845 [Enterobacter sp. A11]